ncbi:hypothetical protein MGN70_008406 [Eutypa lata]|uniref:Signal recognition particle receptor subunit beta n=1 Tax=Eutypa lata (strain UCR-EL1) TaxID=1287681 RepID=M7T7N8_EUTLA|nr:putative srp receptor beta subunit protein [Eutypa lata UCREL1]KAI1249956.1 hypothetical protein MGN70_008406 [Eutypa lata]
METTMEEIIDQLKHIFVYLLTPSTTIFVVGGLIVLLVPILVHFFISRATPYTNLPSILLAGPPGAGKTALLTLLERGANGHAATHTSQAPQAVELTVSRDGGSSLPFREAARDDAPGSHKKFLLVDTPGHGKLHKHAMDRIEASSSKDKEKENGALRGIVFVVDAAALDETSPEGLTAAADYLYEVLLALQRRTGSGRTSQAPRALHVLVAANKLDLFTALPASLVRSRLEAELGRIRRSRSKGLLDSGVGNDDVGSEEQDDWLGAYGSEKFAFGQMREFDVEVEVVGGSVLEGKVDKWWDWISERI